MPTSTFFNLPPPKRENLLRVAGEEFTRKPYGEVSINRIIQAAEIPRGSFYQYFSDKTDLFRYVLGCYAGQMAEMVRTCLEACGGRLLELPLTLFDRIMERYYADPDSFRNLLGIVRQNRGVDISQFLDFHLLRQLLLERADRSQLADRSPEELEILLQLLILITAHSLVAACCGKMPAEEARSRLVYAATIIRYGIEPRTKEEPTTC